jgi:hypothetical protein
LFVIVAGVSSFNKLNLGKPTPCVIALNGPKGIVPPALLYTLTPTPKVAASA